MQSVNIVTKVAFLLQTIANNFSKESLPIAEKAIKALIEMCAGNIRNQSLVIKAQVVNTVITILKSKREAQVSLRTCDLCMYLCIGVSIHMVYVLIHICMYVVFVCVLRV